VSELALYASEVSRLAHSRYVDFPLRVSIETAAVCNAACDFCPYPSLERKGTTMSKLIYKILNDCRDIPQDIPFAVTLARVNEPFLDPRIYDISAWINETLPNAGLNLFSNGTPLTDNNLDRLAKLQRINFLNVSVNDRRPQEYEQVMQLSHSLILERLAAIHRFKAEGRLTFPVHLSRVGDGTCHDEAFRLWANSKFPLFEVQILRRSDWNGVVQLIGSPVADVGCVQWFTLHFLADGRNAFCCIDSDGSMGSGDVSATHALDIYNEPERRQLRLNILSRLDVEKCRNCPMLS
jgi:hypothetical protein